MREWFSDVFPGKNVAGAVRWLQRQPAEWRETSNTTPGPSEVNQLGRTLTAWYQQIVAWHHAQVSNGPTESANNLIKGVKRVAFGFRNYRNYRTRLLLHAGKPNWNLLPNLTPP